MVEPDCPDKQRLADYAAGKLPDELAQSVTSHVRVCPKCQSTLANLPRQDDTYRSKAAAGPAGELPDISGQRHKTPGKLAEYQLLEKLGQGGMGVVYRALHTELDREVALKLLPPDSMHDQRAVGRFRREIKAVGRLDHPNIVRAYDAREANGTHFLVMELVAGVDLGDLVCRLGPLPVAEASEVIRQAAIGLDYAHRHGLVHRDIKPSNLIVSQKGVVKVLDLGLARFRTQAPSDMEVSVSGQALGTPDYMAPEQVQDSHHADIRADLYSLGCTCYFLLAGQAPFSGPGYRSAYDKMAAHVHDPVRPLSEFRDDLPESLNKLLDHLLAKDPDDRFSSPAELAQALRPLAANSDLRTLVAQAQGRSPTLKEQPLTHPMGPPHRPSERHKRAWTFGGLLTAGGVIAIVLLVLLLGHPFRAPTDTATEPEPVVPDSATPTELEPAGWIVMSWTLPGTGKPNLWLFAPNGDRRMPLTDDPEAFDGHPCFSPDGRRVAFIRGVRFDERTSLWICRADGTAQRAVVTPDSQAERLLSPVWLSDSELCYTRDPFLDRRPDMELWSVDVDQGRPRLMFRYGDILQGGNGVVTDVSPDAEELAVVAQSNWPWPTANVYLTDRQGRLLATVWQDDPDDRKDARALWSPDGSQLAWHHNFTRGALADRFYYGIGWAQRSSDGAWRPRLQPNPELTMTPLAWAPGDALLLCARISSNGSRATLVLMDDELQITRELFELETPGWQFGQRDFGRLADWAIIPDDVELPDGQ